MKNVDPNAAKDMEQRHIIPTIDTLKEVCKDINASYMEKYAGPRDGVRIPAGGTPRTKTIKNKPCKRANKTKKYKNGKKHNICKSYKRAKKTNNCKNCKKHKFCKRTKKL